MEKAEYTMVEEGGIEAVVELENDVVQLILSNPKLQCPTCGAIVSMNGRCKTCPSCGWSTCDM